MASFFGRIRASRSKPREATFCGQLLGRLLEGHEDARLAELADAADEELHAQERLAGAGAAADERGPAARQAALGDLIQAADARGALGDPRGGLG